MATRTLLDPDRPARLSTPQLETELLGLAGHLAAAQCRFLGLLAEFDRRGGWSGVGVRSCAHWLTWRIGMSHRTAVEHLRVAHALESLPRITEAFAAGRVSYSKVRAITRIAGRPSTEPDDTGPATPAHTPPAASPAASPAESEQILLDLALAGTASHVETVVRAVRRRQAEPKLAAARRSLSWRWAADGSLVISGRLAPAEGAALIAAVEALVPARAPVAHPVPDTPADWRLLGTEHAPGAVADRLDAARADALSTLVATATATAPDREPGVVRGQARVVVHVDATAGTARIQGGPELPATTAERLACDARAQVLLEDTSRNRLYLGRSRRLASPAQIAALTARDAGRCRFPGCRSERFLHAHHVRSWLRGGSTDVDNLVLLCSFHHTVLHDHGYLIRRAATGWEVLRPDGTAVPHTGPPLGGNVEGLIEIDTRAGLRIDRDSLTPTWGGERLDAGPLLDALLPRPPVAAAAA